MKEANNGDYIYKLQMNKSFEVQKYINLQRIFLIFCKNLVYKEKFVQFLNAIY